MRFLFPNSMSHKLTQRIFSRIQNSTRDYFDSTYHKSQSETEYFTMISEKQIVACYKCRIEIKIGEEYETNHKYGRGNRRKYYYHAECHESLYQ
jgi:5'(3')-deoxyribonucleotidase